MNKTHVSAQHKARIKEELKAAGVTKYGLLKMEFRHLPEVIHPDEHIEAVIYGIRDTFSAILVATDRRVIYLERKPFYSMMDEVTYELVAGIGHNIAGSRASVTLHTRVGNYTLRYVNRRPAEKFINYIEKRRVEHPNNVENIPAPATTLPTKHVMAVPPTDESTAFLHQNQTAVLSTIDRNGNVHGAVVYYFVDAKNTVYILTKADTNKAHNILAHPQMALTVYSPDQPQTLQLQGMAQIEPDQGIKDFVFRQLSQPRNYGSKIDLPPVTKSTKGSYIVIRINLTNSVFSDFSKS